MADDEETQEVEEINEESIKQLAAEAAGGGGDDDGEEEDDEPEMDTGGAAEDMDPQVQVAMERVKSTIGMLKEQNSSTTDRLQTISQNIGEIRQMFHDQESDFNDIQMEVDKMKDQMEELDPKKLSKKMNEIKAEIESNKATVQKLQDKLERVGQTANDAQQTLKELGSMDNLIELNKEFEKKLDEIKEAERYIERLAQKSEKINIQINKKMSEYSTYKARVDALQEKVNDMFRKLDETSIEVEDAVKEDEMEQMRERIKELEEQIDEFDSIAPLAEMSLPEPIVELRDERKDIENFLEDLERKYEKGKIETSKYDKLKEANEEKLETIRKKLVQEWKDLENAADSMEEGGGGSGGGSSGGSPEAPGENGGGGDEDAGAEASDEDEAGEGESEEEPEPAEEDAEEAEGEEGEEADEEAAEESESSADDYEDIVDQSVEDVKETVKNQNLDIDQVIEAEKNGEDRNTLIEWLEGKQ